MRIALTLIASAALLAGCGEKAVDNTSANATDAMPTNIEDVPANEEPVEGNATDLPEDEAASLDSWAGKWSGPEGTSLEIAKGAAAGGYSVKITDLDGPKSFEGTASGSAIVFTRNGAQESLRPVTGDQTGMKWLAGKRDCLMTKVGEGWCRG